jgi:hypothetical protein
MVELEQIPDLLDKLHRDAKTANLYYLNKASIGRQDLNLIVSHLCPLDKSRYFIRVEKDCIDIYINEQKLFDELCKGMKDIIKQAFQPDQDNINLLDRKVIIVKKYPKDDFRYRVYLKPHTIKNREDKIKYLGWLDQNKDYSVSNSVRNWFITTDWNWDRRYMLVKSEPALLMLKLRNADAVGSVYEYMISDK